MLALLVAGVRSAKGFGREPIRPQANGRPSRIKRLQPVGFASLFARRGSFGAPMGIWDALAARSRLPSAPRRGTSQPWSTRRASHLHRGRLPVVLGRRRLAPLLPPPCLPVDRSGLLRPLEPLRRLVPGSRGLMDRSIDSMRLRPKPSWERGPRRAGDAGRAPPPLAAGGLRPMRAPRLRR